MKAVVAADLDGTVVVNSRTVDAREAVVVMDSYASSSSVMSSRAAGLVEGLVGEQLLLPATTRTRAEYERMRWPGGLRPRVAVVANGAEILVEGVALPEWKASVTRALRDVDWDANEAARLLGAIAATTDVSVRSADGWFSVGVVRHASVMTRESIGYLESLVAPRGWVVSVQGRKVYLLPQGLTKQSALRHVVSRLGINVACSIGDSALDRGMLVQFGPAARPAFGELAAAEWLVEGVLVVDGDSPIRAAENLVLWASQSVRAVA